MKVMEFNMSEKRMSRFEAVTLLQACFPLVRKIAEKGADVELTEQDRAIMNGFDRLWAASWLLDPELPPQAGLTRLDINVLSGISKKLRVEEVEKLGLSREEMGDAGWF